LFQSADESVPGHMLKMFSICGGLICFTYTSSSQSLAIGKLYPLCL
jgi:hypothetical protein